jgi:hypothetical protein
MKEYIKNKNFIPEKFYNKILLNKDKKENMILLLFLILNLFLLPITAQDISGIKEESNLSKDNDIKQNKINLDNINIWMESIDKDNNIEEAYINNNIGEIVVGDLNKIDELSSNNSIKIENINLNDNKKYKLGVSLNE